jgi:BASS family bile acid:Na+ symporter
MIKLRKIFLIASGVCAVALLIGIILQQESIYKPFALATAISLAIGLAAVPSFKGYQYTAWIIAAVVAGMLFPDAFSKWGSVDLRDKSLILLIVQVVMFGMGIQMSVRDFSGLAQTGKGVAIGLLCHFSIMPLIGLLLTKVFHFQPEIAAGIILIGSCSSGLASNVMVYLARANLVLSVIITAMATLAAPFLTPFLMKLLAGTLIKIDFVNMMIEIIKIVIVPIFAALLHDYLKKATATQKRIVYGLFAAAIIWLGVVIYLLAEEPGDTPSHMRMVLSGFFAAAIVVGVVYHWLAKIFPTLDQIMPYFSMCGIIYFTTVTTAAGHDNLMKVGVLLFLASMIHNAAGYFFGYWLSRLFRLDKNAARTVAFEVGLQNGGMASGLAGGMGKLGTVGLPAAVFSPWMNISGSILANYWRKRPADDEEKTGDE